MFDEIRDFINEHFANWEEVDVLAGEFLVSYEACQAQGQLSRNGCPCTPFSAA